MSKRLAGTDRHYKGVNPALSVTVHETGNTDVGADAAAHAELQQGDDVGEASWHWQVDDKEAIQSFEHDARCWHAGDGDDPDGGNFTSIAVEICVNSDGDYEKALANANDLIRNHILPDIDSRTLLQHYDWTGKECPQVLRSRGEVEWTKFVRDALAADEEKVSAMADMVSPVKGEVTSDYGWREWSNSFHAGIDIAAPNGTPVHAAYAGKVFNEGADVADYRSGDRNVGIRNPDGEAQYYGHLSRNFVHVGEWVEQGEVIGEVGARGNVTGPHLHFEVWSDWRDESTHRDPMIDFNHFGVEPGSAPQVGTGAPTRPPSGGTTGGNSGGGNHGLSKASVKNIQRALKAMGYYTGYLDGKYGPVTEQAVLDYQETQNLYGNAGLVTDGDWGSVTQDWYEWVEQLQRVLPAWKGVPDLVVDGDYGSKTHEAVETVQRRNDLYADGFAGDVTTGYMRSYGSDIPDRPSNRP